MEERNKLDFLPEFERLVKEGAGATFHGIPTGGMSRDDLCAIIGWFGQEQERQRQRYEHQMTALLFGGRS